MSVINTFLSVISDFQKVKNARKPITLCIFFFSLQYVLPSKNEMTTMDKMLFSVIGKSFLTGGIDFDRSLWQNKN